VSLGPDAPARATSRGWSVLKNDSHRPRCGTACHCSRPPSAIYSIEIGTALCCQVLSSKSRYNEQLKYLLPPFQKRGNLNFSTATGCAFDAVACRTYGRSCSPVSRLLVLLGPRVAWLTALTQAVRELQSSYGDRSGSIDTVQISAFSDDC
jgi:hypothetical protein